jgi:hypothetical protein
MKLDATLPSPYGGGNNKMKKFAVLAVIPLFAGFLYAQERSTESHTTTTKTTYNGTLIDAACQSTHSEHHESTTSTPNQQTTTKSDSRETTDCPVTTTTTSFGLMTSDGKYVRFDDPSNTKIVQVVKTNKDWSRNVEDRQPVKVRVVGTPNGDVVVMETIR